MMRRPYMAILAGLCLLLVAMVWIASSSPDPREEQARQDELEQLRSEARDLNEEGRALANQLEELSAAVGWPRGDSVRADSADATDRLLARIIEAAHLSRELAALTDAELIAEIETLQRRLKGLRARGEASTPEDERRQKTAVALMTERGLTR